MKKQLYVPACHEFIKNEDGSPNYQRIYAVLHSAYRAHVSDMKLTEQELFDFLQANQILPSKLSTEDIDLSQQELCFSIISQYKCNSICQLCIYSPLYKNELENEEAILLSFALSSFDNLKSLKESGLTCRHFRSMIPVSPQSSVLVVPLNRLAFEYLEKIPVSQNDMTSIADKIVSTLKQNNRNKLSDADFEITHKYLLNLSNENYSSIVPQKIADIMKKNFNLSYTQIANAHSNTKDVKKSMEISHTQESMERKCKCSEVPAIAASPCLDGFLAIHKQENISKKSTTQTLCKQANVELSDTKTPSPQKQKPIAISKDISLNKSTNISSSTTQEVLSTYIKKDNHKTDVLKPTPLSRYPKTWTITANEFKQYHIIALDKADHLQIELFFNNILQTPLLPAEIICFNKEMLVLLYARNKYYTFSADNPIIWQQLKPYICRSKFRRLICYEPYLLYYYLFQNHLYSVSIFSIRLTADITESLPNWGCEAEKLLQKLTSSENYLGILKSIPFYYSAFRKLNNKLEKITATELLTYEDKQKIARGIGKSFLLKKYCGISGYLLKEEFPEKYIFTFTGNETMNLPFLSIQYKFTWAENRIFPVIHLVKVLCSNKIFETHQIALLSFQKNEIIFAITFDEYSYICDLINHIIYTYVEEEKTTPIVIDETFLS